MESSESRDSSNQSNQPVCGDCGRPLVFVGYGHGWQCVVCPGKPMSDQPERCPLCGGAITTDIFGGRWCGNRYDCSLGPKAITRVAELVAIRDAVLRWEVAIPGHNLTEIKMAIMALRQLARM